MTQFLCFAGRPGTAMTRAAPPKLKRTKIADIDSTTVSNQMTLPNTALLLEDEKKNTKSDMDEFLVEEEVTTFAASKLTGVNIATLNQEEHGHLVNKIIENTRELIKDANFGDVDDGTGFDMHEQQRIRQEIESVQAHLQQTTQNVQPLSRLVEFITDDFDTILKEIEDSRKVISQEKQKRSEQSGSTLNETLFTLSAQLKNLDSEIRDISLQISSTTSTIIQNEQKIQSILCNQ